MGIFFPTYAAFIVIMYYRELVKREKVAKKLYKALEIRKTMADQTKSKLKTQRQGHKRKRRRKTKVDHPTKGLGKKGIGKKNARNGFLHRE